MYQLMQGNKLTLNIRKFTKKEPKQKIIHIKTQKLYDQYPVVKKRHQSKETSQENKFIKIRHTSVLSKKTAAIKNELSNRQNVLSHGKDIFLQERKFPEIYNPAISSAKYFDFKKYENKYKMASTNSVIEKKKYQSEHKTKRQETGNIEHRKTELSSIHKSFKLVEIQPLKQMTKEKKLQVFKAIRSQFHSLINTSNFISVKNQDIVFRAFVQKGNNGILVKQIMKRRWWWHLEQDKSKANLIWTQWIDKSAISDLSSITVGDETINTQQYQQKKYEQGNIKSQAIKKLVDSNTYGKLENKINFCSNTYFKSRKGSFDLNQNISSNHEDIKVLTVKSDQIIHNHVQGCLHLHSKKLLFMNFHKFMLQKQRDPFAYIPLTFYIQSQDSQSITELLKKFDQYDTLKQQNKDLRNIWICKPGENSNRGCGIKVVKSKQQIIHQINTRLPENNTNRSVIIQKYLQKCFLINNRKFDIRCYILLTTTNGMLKGYWYRDGYIRTSSVEYSLDDTGNQMIHLTNDAVQKKGQDFGKHEDSNKLNFVYFKQYLRKNCINPAKFDQSYEKMKQIAYYLIASVSTKIKRKQFTFQLFGLDFMLDQQLNPILIEANSNPCLSNHGKILGKLIHELVQNVFMTAIDPIFPPPTQQLQRKKLNDQINKDYFETNKFQLIFTGKQKQNSSRAVSLFQNKQVHSPAPNIF